MKILDKIEKYLNEKSGMKAWTKSSVEKFSKTLGISPDEEGYMDACILEMSKHMTKEQAGGFCAKSISIYKGSEKWRKEKGKH